MEYLNTFRDLKLRRLMKKYGWKELCYCHTPHNGPCSFHHGRWCDKGRPRKSWKYYRNKQWRSKC